MSVRKMQLFLLALTTGMIPIITLSCIEHISSYESVSFAKILFSWLPIIFGIFILILYILICNSPQYAKSRKYQYCNAVLILLSLTCLFEAKRINTLVELYHVGNILHILLISFAFPMVICQMMINRFMLINDFQFWDEIKRTNQIKNRFEQTCNGLNLTKHQWLVVGLLGAIHIVFRFSLPAMAIAQSILFISAFYLRYPQFKQRKNLELYQKQNFSISVIAVNYILSHICSILLYQQLPFLSFMIAYSAEITTYLADNRVARIIYLQFDSPKNKNMKDSKSR